jgi:hypothetical protein
VVTASGKGPSITVSVSGLDRSVAVRVLMGVRVVRLHR